MVFDTNVVISALIFGRRLAWLRGAWSSGRIQPVVCRETVQELFRFLRERDIILQPEWVPREELADADAASRVDNPTSFAHAMMDPEFVRMIVWQALGVVGGPDLDVFASRVNRQCPRFSELS